MTPAARVGAAIECLAGILAGAPAEKVLTTWARKSRFAGSKDRAAIRDHVFDALRKLETFASAGGAALPLNRAEPDLARKVMIGLCKHQGFDAGMVFSGDGYGPKALSEQERTVWATPVPDQPIWNMPQWCSDMLQAQYSAQAQEIADALSERAPVDLRVNLAKTTPERALKVLKQDGVEAQTIALSQCALRVQSGARRIKLSEAYQTGLVELQDAGSQALIDRLVACDALKPGTRVLDYCAGGGGKSLAMAAQVQAEFFATDISTRRMADIPARAARAGVRISCLSFDEVVSKSPFDLVLCDAPCSGSGTWRRAPASKWDFTKDELAKFVALQEDVLSKAQNLVRSGGFLAYATCSLFAQENEDQVNKFLRSAENFKKIDELQWLPPQGTDGFYLSVMEMH